MSLTNCIAASLRRRTGLALLAAAVVVALLAAWGAAGTARAFDAQPQQGAPSGLAAQESGGDPEANLPYLFAVFILTWLAFFGYVFYMSRRQREMQREIDDLKRALDERDAQGR